MRARPRGVEGFAAVVLLAGTLGACAATYRAGQQQYDQGDVAQAVETWERAVRFGDARARKPLARAYVQGEGVPRDLDRAAALLEPLARRGDVGAQYELGKIYQEQGDLAAAQAAFAGAAAAGSEPAAVRLARLLADPDNPAADRARAYEMLLPVAESGNVGAQYELGRLYEDNGRFSDAAAWYERAEAAGNERATLRLARLYASGEGVPQDLQRARRMLLPLAQADDRQAQARLGRVEEQLGDPAAAADWFQRAAEQGDAYAQYRLGRLYLRGEGVPRDPTKAREWFSTAAEGGSSAAAQALAEL